MVVKDRFKIKKKKRKRKIQNFYEPSYDIYSIFIPRSLIKNCVFQIITIVAVL